MARNQYYNQLHSPVSTWHRQKHDGIAYLDLDFLSICPACAKPLFLADTIYNKNNDFKGKAPWLQRPYIYVAQKCELPYFLLFVLLTFANHYTDLRLSPDRNLYLTAIFGYS